MRHQNRKKIRVEKVDKLIEKLRRQSSVNALFYKDVLRLLLLQLTAGLRFSIEIPGVSICTRKSNGIEEKEKFLLLLHKPNTIIDFAEARTWDEYEMMNNEKVLIKHTKFWLFRLMEMYLEFHEHKISITGNFFSIHL